MMIPSTSFARMKKGDEITGVVSYVFDGDTISLNDNRIRLQGIDCPESKQYCKDSAGAFYKCGENSTQYMKDLVLNKEVTCTYEGKDRYKRIISICYLDDLNINADMVKSGNSMAWTYEKEYYTSEEESAKKNKLGIWQGDFITPHRWRMKYGRPSNFKF